MGLDLHDSSCDGYSPVSIKVLVREQKNFGSVENSSRVASLLRYSALSYPGFAIPLRV